MPTWFKTWWTALRFRHLVLESLVALSLAFLVWLYTHSRDQNTLDHVQIPVQVQLAPSMRDLFTMEVAGDARVTASFNGPAPRIRELRRRLQRGLVQVTLTLPIPEDRLGDNICSEIVRVEPAHIPVPPGVFVDLAEETTSVHVTLHRMTERMLPVRLDYSGDVRVSQIKVEPATVLVRGPKAILERAQAVTTQPHAIPLPQDPTADPTARGQVDLVSEIEGRPIITNPKQVTFRCKVQAQKKIYDLTDIPVRFLCPPDFPWRPRFASDKAGTLSLRLIGPTSEDIPPVLAFVDLSGSNLARGRNLEPVRLQLPRDFTLVQNTTPVLSFFLEEIERPSAQVKTDLEIK